MRPSRAPAGWLATLVVTGVLGVSAGREASAGAREIAAADLDAARGDWLDAIGHARAAAEAAVPASPWPERGFRRLESIGRDATARGDEPTARLAFAAMKTAALETRSPWFDRTDWVDRAEHGLSQLAAAPPRAGH